VRELAEKYHIALPKRELTPSERAEVALRQSLISMNQVAADFYHEVLMKSEKGRPGIKYLSDRSLSQETIKEFKLGYAPDEWDSLTAFLNVKKMDLEKAVQGGLIIREEKWRVLRSFSSPSHFSYF